MSGKKLTVGYPGNPCIVNEQMEGEVSLLEGIGEVFCGLEGSQVQLHVLQGELSLWMFSIYLFLHTLYGLCAHSNNKIVVLANNLVTVSEYRLFSLCKWIGLLASYNKIPKHLLVGNAEYCSLDQWVRHMQLLVLILVTCHGAVLND